MPFTAQQEEAIRKWEMGCSVAIQAVPGAGKSKVLVEAASRTTHGISLILAYNTELQKATQAAIINLALEDRVACLTFHGLCTRCIALARDDASLLDAIELGEADPSLCDKLKVKAVLLDETQDFRPSFWRLMLLTLELDADTQFMVVGDEAQMLYDYDEDDPAQLHFLLDPWKTFLTNRTKAHVTLAQTHRIPNRVAEFVNNVFGTKIVSAKQSAENAIEVYTINMFHAAAVLKNIISQEKWEDCVLLVPHKRNNRPLVVALNVLSEMHVSLHVRGDVQSIGDDQKTNKLYVSTWHASKGTEAEVVILFGVHSDVKTNPFYVAMTRCLRRVIIIQDVKRVNLSLIRACVVMKHEVTLDAVTRGIASHFEAHNEIPAKNAVVFSPSTLRDATHCRFGGNGRWFKKCTSLKIVKTATTTSTLLNTTEVPENSTTSVDNDDVYRLAACYRLEFEYTKKIVALDDIKYPLRLDYDKKVQMLTLGTQKRIVSKNITDAELLPCALYDIIPDVYGSTDMRVEDWCAVAAAGISWNGYHHEMRQRVPFVDLETELWCENYDYLKHRINNEENLEFDVVQLKRDINGLLAFARCQLVTMRCAWHFIWDSETKITDLMQAAVHACLHASKTCTVLNVKTREEYSVCVQDADVVLEKLLN